MADYLRPSSRASSPRPRPVSPRRHWSDSDSPMVNSARRQRSANRGGSYESYSPDASVKATMPASRRPTSAPPGGYQLSDFEGHFSDGSIPASHLHKFLQGWQPAHGSIYAQFGLHPGPGNYRWEEGRGKTLRRGATWTKAARPASEWMNRGTGVPVKSSVAHRKALLPFAGMLPRDSIASDDIGPMQDQWRKVRGESPRGCSFSQSRRI